MYGRGCCILCSLIGSEVQVVWYVATAYHIAMLRSWLLLKVHNRPGGAAMDTFLSEHLHVYMVPAAPLQLLFLGLECVRQQRALSGQCCSVLWLCP